MAKEAHFGLLLPNDGYPVVSFDHLRRLATEAEGLGFDSVWVADHLLCPPGLTVPFGSKGIFEALMTLSALSSVTQRVKLGTSVLLFPLRHPVLIASMVAALDHASGGRVILGFGVGGYSPEFDACGVPYSVRGAMANEELDLLRALWTEEKVTFRGKYYQLEGVSLEPKPIQPGGPPIVSGGDVGKTLERVASKTSGWFPWGATLEKMQEGMAAIRRRASEVGRDPEEFEFGVGFYGCTTRDKTLIQKEVERVAPYFRIHHDLDAPLDVVAKKTLIGTPEDVAGRLKRYLDIGVRHFIVKHLPFNRELESIRLFAREVIPRFRG